MEKLQLKKLFMLIENFPENNTEKIKQMEEELEKEKE